MNVLEGKKLRTNFLIEEEINGNAFAVIGAFRRQAKEEGWSREEMEKVQNEAMNGDYDHLLQTFMAHCE